MAEQSLLAQAAGDMSAELADKYILASNAAYKLNGNAEKVNEILDGQNMICNRNSVAMADMAAGMSKAGTVASSYNVAVEDLSAMLGTMEAVTKSGGEEVGNAAKSILINLQNINSDKITGTLKNANASMTEFVNGAEKLRNPIDIIRDLAKTFNELDEDDPLRAEIITNVAGKYQASKFAALLQNIDMMDKMLVDYSEGSGSAMREAQKSANSLSGSINSLSNSWTELVNTFADTDGMKGAVNALDAVLQGVTGIADKLDMAGTAGLGAGLFAGIKDKGIFKVVQPTEDNGLGEAKIVTSLKARRIAQEELNASMAKQAAQLKIDTAALQAYEAECAKGAVTTERFASIMDGASAQAQEYAVQTKGAAGSAQAFAAGQKQAQEGLKATADASKTATKATKALGIAGNMIAMWAISKGIELAVKGIDELAHSAEHCKERVSELMSNYHSALDKANSNAETVEGLADKYEVLSKGVNNLGQNVSLTADEYSEYNDIVNQIADMFPTLVQGYTDEGIAILSLKGDVEQLRDAYKEAQQEAYNMLISSGKDSDGNDIIKQWEDTHDTGFWAKLFDLGTQDVGQGISITEAVEQLKAVQNMSAERYREIVKIVGSGSHEEIESLSEIEKDIGYGSYIYGALGIDENTTDKEFAQAKKQAKALVQTYNAEIESALSDVEALANAYLMTNEDYEKLNEESKNAASLMVNNLDAGIASGFHSKTDVGKYVDGIIQTILSNPDAKDAMVSLFKLDTDDMPVGEIRLQVDKYINILAGILEEDPVDLKIRLCYDVVTDEESVLALKHKLSSVNGGAKNQDAANWMDSLTKKELEFAQSDEFINAIEDQKKKIGEASLTTQDYENALNGVKKAQAENGKDSFSFKNIISDANVDDYQKKFSSLESYLEKFRFGDFSPSDKTSLLTEFGIVAGSAEEAAEKVQKRMGKITHSIVADLKEILNGGNISEATRKKVEALIKSLEEGNREAQNFASVKLSGNALADVQSLSEGLDQLDKVYADILDKEDFDFSSVFSADFKKEFGAYTDEYNKFIDTVTSSPDDINACQSAFNDLASAYIYGSKALTEVTEETKDSVIAMLEQKGVTNATAVVEYALAENERMLEAQKYATAQGCDDLTNATYDEINALIEEGIASEDVRLYLAKLALEKWNVNKEELKTKADCDRLLELAKQAGATKD